MSAVELVLRQPWVARAGWTLVHFLWQGTLIAVLLAAVRGVAGRRLTARARYAMACLALGLMTLAPLATFLAAGNPDARALPAPVWRVSGGAAWERALPWLVVVWLCGVAVFSVRLIGGWRLTARLRKVAVRPAPPEWRQALEGLIRRMRVSAPVRLLISSRVAVPMVVGWLRPVILMPAAALTGLPLEQVQALLAHELAHIFRHDYLVNILQNVAEALLFYHPAVWWVSGQIRTERELCCDDLAVAACGDALTYAYALADLDSGRRSRLNAALAADGGSLLQRLRRLAGESEALSHNLPGPGTAWALSLLWLAGIGAAAIHGAQTPVAHVFHATPQPSAAASVAPTPVSPPRKVRAPASPVVSALLFDPFFAPPQAAVAGASGAEKLKNARVEGTVSSLTGEPLKKATVRLTTNSAPANQGPASYAETTDDAGKFAIEDVQPGSYTLSATKTGFLPARYGARTPTAPGATLTVAEGAALKDLDIKLTPQGILAGRLTDYDGEPVPHGWVKLFSTVYVNGRRQYNHMTYRTNSLGEFSLGNVSPGRYYLSGEVLEQSPDVEPGMGDVATYYPNALEPAAATLIEVTAAARLEGINLRLRRERVYSVTGRVMLNGAPVKAQVSFSVIPPMGRPSWPSQTLDDGSFRMHDQLPGVYTLLCYGGAPALRTVSGRLQFTIKDSNLNGLPFALDQGVEVNGVLKVDGADWQSQFTQPGSPSGAPSPVSRPYVRLIPDEEVGVSRVATANDDGTFQMQPIGTGRYRLGVMPLPKGAYVKSAHYGQEDVTRAPLEIGGRAAPLEIDISLKAATITGALSGDNSEPLSGVQVTAWPKVPNLGDSALGVKSASTDQRGAFSIAGLPPGEYYVAAWEEIDSGLRTYPDFLAKFTDRAAAVKLDEGSQASVAVKLIPRDAVAAEAAKLP